jgi:GTP-binding protein
MQPFLMRFIQSAAHYSELPATEQAEVCIVGRSNVGKSSLLNALSGQKKLAKVSSTPGRTRLLNLFEVRVQQPAEKFFGVVDLPGYGFAKVSGEEQRAWQDRMRGYFENRASLCGFLFLVDVRRTPTPEDRALFSWLRDQDLSPLVVVTKAEKIHKSKFIGVRKDLAKELLVSADSIVITSAHTGLGFDVLQAAMQALLPEPPTV